MKPHRTRFLSLAAAAATAAMVLAACSSNSSSGSGSAGNGSKAPILIGTSLSLTGDFSADGLAFKRGYQLWASQVNSHGGLLGRKVQMVFLNDSSDPTTVATNYTKLIAQQHVAEVVLVSDDDIRDAQRTLWERLRVVAEPGGAAAFAALLAGRYQPRTGERAGVIVCGANTDAVRFAG